MPKNSENNGTGEIGLVTPTPVQSAMPTSAPMHRDKPSSYQLWIQCDDNWFWNIATHVGNTYVWPL